MSSYLARRRKISAANARDFAAKFPGGAGKLPDVAGSRCSWHDFGPVNPEVKFVQGPEFPPLGAGNPVKVL